jgi:hypothetical protein
MKIMFRLVIPAILGAVTASAANAQASGVNWSAAPLLTLDGAYNSINLSAYGSAGLAGTTMSFGAGATAGQIMLSGNSYSNYLDGTSGSIRNPDGSLYTGRMLGVLPGSEASIQFTTRQAFFGMRWGSVDPGNTLSFYDGNQLVYNITAASIANATGISTGSFDATFNFSELRYDRVVMTNSVAGTGFEAASFIHSEGNVAVAPIPLGSAAGLVAFLGMMGARGRGRERGGRLPQSLLAFASLAPRRQQVHRFA